jgi:cysteinyl-tRNA synthetase
MSMRCLGEHFDIHGGGLDLQFPHHDNEIAQSEGATGGRFVELWLHNGIVRVDGEKMAKSLGNFFTVRDVLARCRAEELRFLLVSGHYRSPLNFSEEAMATARAGLTRLYTALRGLEVPAAPAAPGAYVDRFNAAMDDDFNTPEALAVLFDLARDLNRNRAQSSGAVAELACGLRGLGARLGLLGDDPEQFLHTGDADGAAEDADIGQLVEARGRARARKDWPEADRLRAELERRGIVLEDTASGTIWRRR